jgi:hypothetical protein
VLVFKLSLTLVGKLVSLLHWESDIRNTFQNYYNSGWLFKI